MQMLELGPTADSLVAFMSMEQRKRLNIGLALAGNPALLFLDEPTTGLDSRAAQLVSQAMLRVANSGRTLVCTIHQPSTFIFSNFHSLLLLQRGGQTVFFGELGQGFGNLISHFQSAPNVDPFPGGKNPATWMLELAAGGGSRREASQAVTVTDFAAYYCGTALALANNEIIASLTAGAEADPAQKVAHDDVGCTGLGFHWLVSDFSQYPMSMGGQFWLLFWRTMVAYWRTPSYNFTRFIFNTFIALLFASVFADQNYDTDIAVISRSAILFIGVLFCGILGMNTVIPVTIANREAFYREQQEGMYSPLFYEIALGIVELPYLALTSLVFSIPFFFIIGLDGNNTVDTTEKFFWFWLFLMLFVSVCVFFGQLLAIMAKDAAAATVFAGFFANVNSMFCGFLIKSQVIIIFSCLLYAYRHNAIMHAFSM
jgi:ABC-type multidrug transport system permease subunit